MKEFHSSDDIRVIEELIKKLRLKKLFITGDVGVGKSCFCRELCKELEFQFIELDKERDKNIKLNREEVLGNIIKKRKNHSYILEHYQLLDPTTLNVWKDEADALILLCPKRPNIGHGDEDYDTGSKQKERFDELSGEMIYENCDTGTYLKKIKS